MTNEVWKEHRWFPYYEVSNMGRLRTWWDPSRGAFLAEKQNVDIFVAEDRHVARMYKGSYVFRRFVDELVAETFCENPDGAVTVVHRDGNLLNDIWRNLCYEDPVARDPVIAIDTESNAKRFFCTRKEAADTLGLQVSSVSKSLSGEIWRAGRWTFQLGKFGVRHSGKALSIVATDVETGRKLIFSSQSEAARALGLRQQNISSVLSGRLKRTGKWTFEYNRKI